MVDLMEGIAVATVAASPDMRKKVIIGAFCLVIIGAAIGFLGGLYFIMKPLNDHYQTELNRITTNGKLTCYDMSNMTPSRTGNWALFDMSRVNEYCGAISRRQIGDTRLPSDAAIIEESVLQIHPIMPNDPNYTEPEWVK